MSSQQRNICGISFQFSLSLVLWEIVFMSKSQRHERVRSEVNIKLNLHFKVFSVICFPKVRSSCIIVLCNIYACVIPLSGTLFTGLSGSLGKKPAIMQSSLLRTTERKHFQSKAASLLCQWVHCCIQDVGPNSFGRTQ